MMIYLTVLLRVAAMYGFENDEPTEQELKEFEEKWCHRKIVP